MSLTLLKSSLLAACLVGASATAIADHDAYGPRDGAGRMFKALDANEDGVIARDEVIALQATRFADIDSSGDGVITKEEITAHVETQMRERLVSETAQKRRDRRFAAMDANGDGVVSEEEFVNRALARFDARDDDGDGALTVEELPRPKNRKK